MRVRTMITLLLALSALGLGVPTAGAATYSAPVQLTGAAGGEPSIATDPLGDVFVDGPQGIPSGTNGHPGVGFWVSRNDGTTFGPATYVGSDTGGGDSDVLYSKGAVYVADLEATAAQICKSTDRGATFFGIGPTPDPGNCTTTNGGQAGPSDDRQWLTAAPDGTLYLTYHEFVSAQPIAFRSDNAGADDFSNTCGPLITDPTIESNVPTDITGGTLVARPVTDQAGNFYVLFATTTQTENAAAAAQGQPSGTFSQLYLAKSTDKCKTFTDYTVFDGEKLHGENTVQFGDIFNDLVIDGAGNLYVVGAGYIGSTPFATHTNVYLFSSRDHGETWSAPAQVGDSNAAHMLPAAVGGPSGGQLSIGYFRTVNGVTDPNATTGKWTYSTAQSSNAASATPTFTYSDVNPGFIYHNGDICNQGILCGSTPNGPSDRSLLDFTAAALDSHGCPVFTFAGNPTGAPGKNDSTNTYNYVTRQTSDCFALPSSSSGSGPGAGAGSGSGTGPGSGSGTGSGSGSGTGSGSGSRSGNHQPVTRPGCPLATGRLTLSGIGLARLGMTRPQAHRAYRRSSTRGRRYEDFFCLTPVGIRVGYASPALLRTLSGGLRRRLRGRVVWVSTSNRRYAVGPVRAGASLKAARRALQTSIGFPVGRNTWFFARRGRISALLKVRHGQVQEIGIVPGVLARNRRAQRVLVRSFS
jgi:hypothetical protein